MYLAIIMLCLLAIIIVYAERGIYKILDVLTDIADRLPEKDRDTTTGEGDLV
jgi:hypothetical protein